MTLDAQARAFAEGLQRSTIRVDPVAGLQELLRRRRRRRITRAATALVAAAAVVAVVAWIGVREADHITPIVNPPPGALGRVAATIPVGPGPLDVLASQDAVWVANAAQGTISRVDPGANTVTRTIQVGRNPVRLAVGFGSIWVANQTSQTVSRIDVRTGQPQATIPVTGHSSADDLAVGEGTVWVRSGARLLSLDLATNRMVDRTGDWEVGGDGVGGTAVVDNLLWLPARPAQEPARWSGWTRRPAGSSTGSLLLGMVRWRWVGAASGRPESPARPSTGTTPAPGGCWPRSRSGWWPST
jgi:YVTN family beta-propeller protein